MVAALALAVLVVAFVAVSWATRHASRKPRCCNPGQWPPDDLSAPRR